MASKAYMYSRVYICKDLNHINYLNYNKKKYYINKDIKRRKNFNIFDN